jgi:hypothetical protein
VFVVVESAIIITVRLGLIAMSVAMKAFIDVAVPIPIFVLQITVRLIIMRNIVMMIQVKVHMRRVVMIVLVRHIVVPVLVVVTVGCRGCGRRRHCRGGCNQASVCVPVVMEADG